MKKRQVNFLFRLILFSVFVGTIPMLILGMYSYYKASTVTQEKVNQGNMQFLQQTQLRVEQLLKTTDYALTHYINSTFVNELLQQYLTANDFQIIYQLMEGLKRLGTYELGIREAYMVNLQKDWAVGYRGLMHPDDVLHSEDLRKYAEHPKTSFWFVKDTAKENTESPSYTIKLIKKLPVNSTQPSGLVILTVASEEINKLLSKIEGLDDIMILDSDFRTLAEKDVNNSKRPLSSELIEQLRGQNGNSSGVFTASFHDNISAFTFSKSAYNGWTYLSVISIKKITKDTEMIGWITFWLCSGVLLLTLIISLVGSSRIYLPIRRMRESLVLVPGADTYHKGDELQFISESIQTLLKKQTQMTDQIQGQMNQLQEFLLHKLFKGELKNSEIEDKLQKSKYPLSWKWLCVLTLQIDTLEGTRYEEKENDKELLLFAINNVISELVPPERRLRPILIDQSQVTLIGMDEEDMQKFREEIFNLAKHIKKTVIYYFDLNVSIGVSRPFREFNDTPKAYKEGLEALKYSILLGPKAVLDIEDVQPGKSLPTTFPVQQEQELLNSIQRGDTNRVDEALHEFITEVFKENARHQVYQISLMRLLIDLIRMVQDSGVCFDTLYSDDKPLFDQLAVLKTKKEIASWYRNSIIQPIIQQLEKHQESQFKKISDRIIEIIHNEYDSDINLEACAARMNFHPSYIRRVFRKETGMNFSDYLSEYRLSMAKKWLNETDMKVTEIAEKLRYNNSQNFIRYFRKMVGVTPGQYRAQNI